MGNIIRNLDFQKGDDHIYNITIESVIDGVSTPVDLTGYTVYFTVKINHTDPDIEAIIKKEQATHIDPTNGKTTIVIAASDTANLTLRKYFYDMEWVDDSDKTRTFLKGVWALKYEVTHND